jgi:hypothetical protein
VLLLARQPWWTCGWGTSLAEWGVGGIKQYADGLWPQIRIRVSIDEDREVLLWSEMVQDWKPSSSAVVVVGDPMLKSISQNVETVRLRVFLSTVQGSGR